jgi:hypothetical protein
MLSRFTAPIVGLVVALAVLITASPAAFGQPLEMKNPPSKRERVPPAIPDRDLRPTPPAVPHKPGFIPGLSKKTKTGRIGVAGWTAPNVQAGSRGAADPESSGVAGFGFAAEWGGTPGRADVEN